MEGPGERKRIAGKEKCKRTECGRRKAGKEKERKEKERLGGNKEKASSTAESG